MFELLFGFLYKCVVFGGILMLIGVVLIYLYQDKLLYVPNMPSPDMKYPENNPNNFRSPSEYSLDYEDVTVWVDETRANEDTKTTSPTSRKVDSKLQHSGGASDKIKLHGWFIKQKKPIEAETVIYFHENAGNIGFRLPN